MGRIHRHGSSVAQPLSSPIVALGTAAFVAAAALALQPGEGGAQPADRRSATTPVALVSGTLVSAAGTFELELSTEPDPIRLNEYFELVVEVRNAVDLDDGDSFWVDIDAQMPIHDHGMNTRPIRTQAGAGRFVFSGMLFHMAGLWEIRIEVAQGRAREQAAATVELAPDSGIAFSDDERRAIYSLSPVPAVPADPTNRVAEDAGAVALGRALFFDPRLSGDGAHSCATCHDPERAWADGEPVASGAATGRRNTPSLWNAGHNRWFSWDGSADSLWSQALKPIEDSTEMNGSRLAVVHLLARDPALQSLYGAAFGELPDILADPSHLPASGGPRASDAKGQLRWWRMPPRDQDSVNAVFADAGKAIAAFVATIATQPAPFDRFVAELRSGKRRSDAISASAQRGLRIFVGTGRCVLCHSGPMLTNMEFHDIRVPPLDPPLPRDLGRFEGIQRLFDDEFIAAGPYSDDRDSLRAQQLAFVRDDAGVIGHFKTPGLRNVAETAPYMHQGQFRTLRDVVRHYSTLESAVAPADPAHVEFLVETPLSLTDSEIDDVVAFLESLSSD